MRTVLVFAIGLVSLECMAQDTPALSQRIAIYNPEWSPDGRTILFESNIDGRFGVYTIAFDGSGLRRLSDPTAVAEQPRWSPDGRLIVYSMRPNIHVMKADGSDSRAITSMPRGSYYQSSFSPDGRYITFQGAQDAASTRARVYVMRADGSDLRLLSDSAFGAEGPEWTAGGRITYRRVPYPKDFWRDMGRDDVDRARAGSRLVSVLPDGSGLVEVPTPQAPGRPNGVPEEARVTRDGRRFVFTRDSAGWSTLIAHDAESHLETVVLDGKRAGPLGYLRSAVPVSVADTFDTYLSSRTGEAIRRDRGAWFVRTVARIRVAQWVATDTWFDSTGVATARQARRTVRGSLATELEAVRAAGDSASLLVHEQWATGWVVPQGQGPRLIDGPVREERFAEAFVFAAIAQARPAAGRTFLVPTATLYGANPLVARVDSIQVVRVDTLRRGTGPVAVAVLRQPDGRQTWVDLVTGSVVVKRGNAGPQNWWWHVQRGVLPGQLLQPGTPNE